jgi:hypothetical protein
MKLITNNFLQQPNYHKVVLTPPSISNIFALKYSTLDQAMNNIFHHIIRHSK